MTILDRYITAHLAVGWLLVFALLGVVFGLFAFIDELNHTTGNYQALQALYYVTLTTPQRVLELFPVIALLGTLIAFATLSRSSELVVIMTSGISSGRLALSATLPGLLLMLLLWPAGEYVAAPMYQQAEAARQEARTGSAHALGESGLWSTDGQNFYHIGGLSRELTPVDVNVYEMDAGGSLERALRADSAEPVSERTWRLRDVRIKQVETEAASGRQRLTTHGEAALMHGGFWSIDELASLTLTPQSMSLSNLYAYLRHLRETGQNVGSLRHLFWQRASLPVATLVMVVLGFQLSAGMLRRRSRNVGLQVGIGVATGLFFYLASQVIYAGGTLFRLDPRLVAVAPILMVLAATAALHRYRA